ncbi:MAG: hypothetical protein HC802_07270 [Caldilineaceae bacterium]|nr:hypothetical protein [Caldilineaceae bacterium]
MALPVAYIALMWLLPDGATSSWLAAIPLSGGLLLAMPWLTGLRLGGSAATWRFVSLAALLLAIHAFTYPTILKPTTDQQTVGVGVIQNLWRDLESEPALAAWAILLSTLFVVVAVVAILRLGRK